MVIQLVKKELDYVLSSLKSTILIFLVFVLCMPLGGGIGFATAMPALGCYTSFFTIESYEERSKTYLLDISLPVTRRELCLAKYVSILFYTFIATVLSILGGTLRLIFVEHLSSNQILGILPSLVGGMLLVAGIYSGFFLPAIFKFGVVNGRYILMASYIIIFSVAGGINTLVNEETIGTMYDILSSLNSPLTLLVVLGVYLMVMGISYKISLRIWKRKDFV